MSNSDKTLNIKQIIGIINIRVTVEIERNKNGKYIRRNKIYNEKIQHKSK